TRCVDVDFELMRHVVPDTLLHALSICPQRNPQLAINSYVYGNLVYRGMKSTINIK
ncbi:hypothetical protein J6590_104456, partial [Homalodisca vitripennis]